MTDPIGFILGSGWQEIANFIKSPKVTTFREAFGKSTTVFGHQGKVIEGEIFNKKVVLLLGRFHTYEGYSSSEVVETVRFLHKKGVKKITITAACGGLNPDFEVGDVIILTDIITLFCQSPLLTNQFQNLSAPFSSDLIKVAKRAARTSHLDVKTGTHVFVRGPHYESFADKKVLRLLGADVVGMSMVPEVIMANFLGMEVLGLSLVTNLAFVKHSHKEVLAAGKKKEPQLKKLLKELIRSF